MSKAMTASKNGGIVLITDVRFDNEAKAIRDAGGIVIQIVGRDVKITNITHSSEAGVNQSYVNQDIVNDGSLVDLENRLVDAINSAGINHDHR
jgi:hypothetical protein